MRIVAAIFVIVGCLVLARPVAAQQDLSDIVITEIEKRIIKEHYRRTGKDPAGSEVDRSSKANKGNKAKGKGKGLPPGLAKRDTLPPGLAKRQELPPGLNKRDLPDDLQAKLGQPAKGTQRVLVDDNVVLIEEGTNLVLDVLEHVLTQ